MTLSTGLFVLEPALTIAGINVYRERWTETWQLEAWLRCMSPPVSLGSAQAMQSGQGDSCSLTHRNRQNRPPLFRDRHSSKDDKSMCITWGHHGPREVELPQLQKEQDSNVTQGPWIRIKVLSLKLNASWWWGTEIISGVQQIWAKYLIYARLQVRGSRKTKSSKGWQVSVWGKKGQSRLC